MKQFSVFLVVFLGLFSLANLNPLPRTENTIAFVVSLVIAFFVSKAFVKSKVESKSE